MNSRTKSATATSVQEDKGVLVAQVGNTYWLLQGEPHLDAILSGQEPYPMPVRCVRVSSQFQLDDMMPGEQSTTSLWSIHPAIIGRLKLRDELVVFDAPVLD